MVKGHVMPAENEAYTDFFIAEIPERIDQDGEGPLEIKDHSDLEVGPDEEDSKPHTPERIAQVQEGGAQ